MHRQGTVLILIHDDPGIRIQYALAYEVLLKKIDHRQIHVIPYGDVRRARIAPIGWVFPDPAPRPSSNRIYVILRCGNAILTEPTPQRIDTGMGMSQNELRVSTKSANGPDNRLGLSASRRRLHKTR